MNSMTIYTKTSKGVREAVAEAPELAPELFKILTSIDGKHSVEALRKQVDYLPAGEFAEALATLAAGDYIRDSAQLPDSSVDQSNLSSVESMRKAKALRAKIRARREGTEHPAPAADTPDAQRDDLARRDGELQSRREAEELMRKEGAEQVTRDAEEQEAGRRVAERARQEAEEQARRDAEEEARRKAAEQARLDAEEQARRDTEEQEAGRRAAERARQEAEAKEWRDAEDEARRVREEEAAGHARWMAEEKAWREEEAAARDRAKARATVQGNKTAPEILSKWGKALGIGFIALVVGGLVMIHLISFDGQIPQFEKSLAGQFQQPVKIKALRLGLVPQNYVGLEGVSIGSEGQIRVSRIKLVGGIGNLFGDKKEFKSAELDSPVVTEEGMSWLLFGRQLARNMVFGQVSAVNVNLDSKSVSFPAFDAKLQSGGEGAWKTIAIESQDKNISLELTSKGELVQVDFKARSFKIPFGSALTLDDMVANGVVDRSGLTLAEFKGFAYGGILGGNARLKWGPNWSLEGELNAKQIDTARLIPELMDGGRLEGKAFYVMQAAEATKLFAASRLEGDFIIPRGTLLGTDLGSLLQGGRARGDTKFTDLAASFVHDRGATRLQQVRLRDSAVSASGMVEVDVDKNVRGRLVAEIKFGGEQRRANLTLSGTLKQLEWRR